MVWIRENMFFIYQGFKPPYEASDGSESDPVIKAGIDFIAAFSNKSFCKSSLCVINWVKLFMKEKQHQGKI